MTERSARFSDVVDAFEDGRLRRAGPQMLDAGQEYTVRLSPLIPPPPIGYSFEHEADGAWHPFLYVAELKAEPGGCTLVTFRFGGLPDAI